MFNNFKSILLAGLIVFVVVMAFRVSGTITEGLSCFIGSCEKEMAATIEGQKKTIEQLQKDLKEAQDEVKLIKGNKDDNAEALTYLCEKKEEIRDRADNILDDALRVSKPSVKVLKSSQSKEEFISGKDIINEPSETLVISSSVPENSIYDNKAIGKVSPEKIIDGLWIMYCEGNKNVCKETR